MSQMDARPKRTWSLESRANRASYSALAGLLAFGVFQSLAGALLVGFVLFLLLSAIVLAGRRR